MKAENNLTGKYRKDSIPDDGSSPVKSTESGEEQAVFGGNEKDAHWQG